MIVVLLGGVSRRGLKARSCEHIPEQLREGTSDSDESEFSGRGGTWGSLKGKRRFQTLFERQVGFPKLNSNTVTGLHRMSSSAPGCLKSIGIATWVPAGLNADDSARALQLVRVRHCLIDYTVL